MNTLEIRNQKIIDAVLEKEKAVCPGAIALIGIYGSFQTGDIHPYSDLDLLILINDDRGWQLGTAFIQDDLGVGHDIYCTNWEWLRQDACFEHPHISKLMDSRIVYCADEKYMAELEKLREQVRLRLSAPFGEADCQKAEKALKEALQSYACAMTAENPGEIRRQAGNVIYFTENAVAMLNKAYFRKGVKQRFEELNAMEKRPRELCEMIGNIVSADTVGGLKEHLTLLVRETKACVDREKQSLRRAGTTAGAEALKGTFEEMFSNWHGKMYLAAETGSRYLAFMSLVSLNEMLCDIGRETDIETYDVLSVYDPDDLKKTAKGFDAVLQHYLVEYRKAGLKENRYPDIDAFLSDYLSSRPQTGPEEVSCGITSPMIPEET